MKVHFVRLAQAYLPELDAYDSFLRALGHQACLHTHVGTIPADAQVVWWMCGRVPAAISHSAPGAFHVHEYSSASVPPFAWLKDRVKRYLQPRPDYRIFQNEWVRRRFDFRDGRPSELRDMGVAPAFLEMPPHGVTPDHDFVYLGEMRRLRGFLRVFDALELAGLRVLLVGQLPDDLAQRLGPTALRTVTGRVPHAQVPSLLRRARVGLNLVPDRAPFNLQTSTKLLEYCACGLHVLSTDYPWVRDFARQRGGDFSYLAAPADPRSVMQDLAKALQAQAQATAAVVDVRALAWPRLLGDLHIWRTIGVEP
ncbi:glycosyltransferase [Ramlibacter tataouinensis]|uniref:Glycosyltransferase n=1 Tax=Ramlibacter tataouinensis (strain ATCC BAA-407 / DSM 14655 / LMG 21543 / TTB310) TaxID=365046 RepID=F5Y5Q1_RAMTT|nr:glycosyltransferase [Ramlibacter tataouinensis]AEG93935.1 conserved hypothetical protein [Ramlibacter tataouinensis TTB310]